MMPIQMALFLVFLLATPLLAADPVAENLTETADEAEYRQGGIAAPGYPAGMYGAGPMAYAQYGAAGTTGGAGYMNVLRNLYRPPSLGLTDKVKHWVKSFMNRRQAVKPFYGGAPGLQYQPDEFGAAKPVIVANGYKAISVPLRQLQKYYKTPFYEGQFQNPQQQQQPASASSSVLSFSSPGSGGLYGSETANSGAQLFQGGNSGLFGGAGGFQGGNIFGSDASSALYGGSPGAAGLFSGNPGGVYSSGASGFYPSANDEATSALFGAGGLTGAYAAAAGNYQHQSSGAPSGGGSAYSLDGGSSSNFGSDQSYFGNGGASQYGSDLYASGASPQATIYNPNEQQNRGYSGGSSSGSSSSSGKKQQKYGASSSALYIPSSSDSVRLSDSHQMRSGGSHEGQQQAVNSFNVDSSRGGAQETSYSVSFQPAQGKSYSATYDNSGFQPVSYGSEDGLKGKSS